MPGDFQMRFNYFIAMVIAIALFTFFLYYFISERKIDYSSHIANKHLIAAIDWNNDHVITADSILSGEDKLLVLDANKVNRKPTKLLELDFDKDGFLTTYDPLFNQLELLSLDLQVPHIKATTAGILGIKIIDAHSKKGYKAILPDGTTRWVREH